MRRRVQFSYENLLVGGVVNKIFNKKTRKNTGSKQIIFMPMELRIYDYDSDPISPTANEESILAS
jgi:hypothetical protein